eukprot:SAG11_NODE_5434_length_1561_cov_4.338577_1_plen_196_part_00
MYSEAFHSLIHYEGVSGRGRAPHEAFSPSALLLVVPSPSLSSPSVVLLSVSRAPAPRCTLCIRFVSSRLYQIPRRAETSKIRDVKNTCHIWPHQPWTCVWQIGEQMCPAQTHSVCGSNGGTEAQRHKGTERRGGTEARRHGGTEARRHGGTEAQRHSKKRERRDRTVQYRARTEKRIKRLDGVVVLKNKYYLLLY